MLIQSGICHDSPQFPALANRCMRETCRASDVKWPERKRTFLRPDVSLRGAEPPPRSPVQGEGLSADFILERLGSGLVKEHGLSRWPFPIEGSEFVGDNVEELADRTMPVARRFVSRVLIEYATLLKVPASIIRTLKLKPGTCDWTSSGLETPFLPSDKSHGR